MVFTKFFQVLVQNTSDIKNIVQYHFKCISLYNEEIKEIATWWLITNLKFALKKSIQYLLYIH